MMNSNAIGRRDAAKLLAAGALAPAAPAQQKAAPFMGVQLGPHSVFDEGADRCLDLLQETAGINAVFVYSHTYQGYARGRKPEQLAQDHGVTPKDPANRKFPLCWVKWHEPYYAGTFLRHPKPSPEHEFAGKDVFETLAEPAKKRGMKVFARILEGHGKDPLEAIAGWGRILTIDAFGRRTIKPCWNHPAYRAWWLATIEDLFKTYPLAGLKWESERNGPFASQLLASGYNRPLTICFCPHCEAEAKKRDISFERARKGYQELDQFTTAMRAGKPSPADGVYISLLRLLIRYPEILAWEQLWNDSKESLKQEIYGLVKQISPQASVGWHIHHAIAWDPIVRATFDYARMADYSDWIKPVVYHDVAGPRTDIHAMEPLTKGVMREVPAEATLAFLYGIFGYDAKQEPSYAELTKRGFSAEYVYRETKRCVDAVAGKCAVYPGVGFDIPGQARPSDPETIYLATKRAFDAGAAGLIVSREYDEMRVPSLRAVGRAVRERKA